MATDVRIWTGTAWQSIMGPAGPTAVSTDALNCSRLGADGKIHTPALPLSGGTVTGPLILDGGSANFTIRSTAGQINLINENGATGVVTAQYRVQSQSTGSFRIFDITANANRMLIQPTGGIDIPGSLTVTGALMAGGNAYPTVPGTTGQVLGTNGAGSLTWVTPTAGGGPFLLLTGGTVTGTLTVNQLTNCLNGFAANGNIFPADKGANGQVLMTNGAGALSWTARWTQSLPLEGGTVTGSTTFSAGLTAEAGFTHGGNAYPTTRGTNGQVLTTNGVGVLSWTTVAAAGGSFLPLTGGTLTGDLTVDRGAATGTVFIKGAAAVIDLTDSATGANWRLPVNTAGEFRINKTGATPASRVAFTGADATFVERSINSTALGPVQFAALQGTRAVALTDIGKIVLCDAAGGDINLFLGTDVTIPVGSVFEVINPTSVKVKFFNDASVFMFFNVGDTQFGSTSAAVEMRGRNTAVRVVKTAANTWMLFGDLANGSVRDGGSRADVDMDAAAVEMVRGAMEAQADHDARYRTLEEAAE